MKAELITKEAGFKPIEIKLTFETREELVFFKSFIGYHSSDKAAEEAGMPYPEGDIAWKIYKALPEI